MTTGWKKAGMSWRKDTRWESLSKKYGKNRDHIRKMDKSFCLIQKIITKKKIKIRPWANFPFWMWPDVSLLFLMDRMTSTWAWLTLHLETEVRSCHVQECKEDRDSQLLLPPRASWVRPVCLFKGRASLSSYISSLFLIYFLTSYFILEYRLLTVW